MASSAVIDAPEVEKISDEPRARRGARKSAPVIEIEDLEMPAPETPAEPADKAKSFFATVAATTPEEWERRMVYVYRLEPITDRLAGGSPHKFIAKYVSAFDEDSLMKDHGSGRYRCVMNERSNTGKEKTIARVEIDIENSKYPPRVPPGEWVDDVRNRKWAAWMPQAKNPADPAAGNMSDAFQFVRQIISELRPDQNTNVVQAVLDAVKDTRRELAGNSDPNRWIDAVKAFAPLVAPFIAQMFAPKDDTMLKLLLQSQQEKDAMIRALIEAKSSPAGNLKDTLQTIALVRDEFGGSRSSGNDSMNWSKVIEALAPTAMQMFMRPRPQGPMMMPAAAAMPPQNAPQQPAAPAGPGITPDAPQEPAAAAATPLQPDQLQQIQELVMSNAKHLFRFLNSGRSGLDYADYFIEGNSYGEFLLLRNFGYANLITSIQQFPAAWQLIAPIEPQFAKFMQEFYSWTAEEEETEGDDDAEGKAA